LSPTFLPIGRLGFGLALLGLVGLFARPALAVTSYPIAATDAAGSSTGAASVALGVPDYEFVNDVGLGGANADVFGPGESTVLLFPAAIRNVAGQPDLLVSAFVGGTGATDSAQVQVSVSSDGTNFVNAGSFDTADGRDVTKYPFPEVAFESVKHFAIDLGAADNVTHVRLTNLASTATGLRLDAVEGLQPRTLSDHAFEIRFEKYRNDSDGRFMIRIKNTGRAGGVPVRELRIDRSMAVGVNLQDTSTSLCEQRHELWSPLDQCPFPARFICVENCVPDNGPSIEFSRHAWSTDGVSEAPAGAGLDPGRQAMNLRNLSFDTDPPSPFNFLDGFAFTVTFADGFEHSFTFNEDVLGQMTEGALFQKYQYFSPNPTVFGPRPVYYYEFVPEPGEGVAAVAAFAALLLLARGERRGSRARRFASR
jgi:hypothetical protein